MLALRDLDDYADAERVRKKIEACVVAMITQPEGIEGSWLGFKGNDPLTTHPVESFQPGMTAYLKPGEDVKFNNRRCWAVTGNTRPRSWRRSPPDWGCPTS